MAIGGMAVASLFAKIGADTGPFERAMRGVESDLKSAGKHFGGFQSIAMGAFKAVGAAGVAAFAGLGATIVSSTKAAANMEQQMADIRAVMGLTTDQTAALEKHISDLGLDPKLKVSAVEAAQTVEMLAKNGLNLDQIMGGAARSAILLSNATGGDFAMSADLATDAMAIFKIKAEDMDKAVNGIVGTTQASKFSIEDYALALAQGGGVAASVGVSFEDFNATIAAISPLFASGSDAGTSFKTFLQRLVPQSEEAVGLMKDLGLMTEDGANAFFDASGQMKSMSEIAGIMQRAFSGLSEEQKNEAASTIFGTDAMRAAFALIEAGSGTIDKYKAAIGATNAEEAAATRMDTFKGQLEILSGIIETISIDIGRKFLPVSRRMVEWFASMAQTHGPGIVAMFGKVAEWLEKTITSSVTFAQSLAGRFMPALKSIIGFVTNAVPNAYRKFREIVDNVSDPGLMRMVNRLRAAFFGLGKVLSSLARPFKDAFSGLFTSLMQARGRGWAGIFDVLITRLRKAVSELGRVLQNEALPFILEQLKLLGNAMKAWIASVDWGGKLAEWGKAFLDWAVGLWEWVAPHLTNFWNWLTSWITDPTKRQQLWDGIVRGWNVLTDWAIAIWEWAKPGLITGWNWLSSWFTDPAKRQQLWDGIAHVWDVVSNWAIDIWNWAKPALVAGWNWLSGWFTDASKRQQLWEAVKTVWNVLTNWAVDIWNWAAPHLAAGWQWLSGWFTNPQKREELWKGIALAWDWIVRWANAIWLWIEPTLSAMWQSLTTWISDPTKRDELWKKITEAWTGFTTWASATWGDIAPGLASMWTAMKKWIDENVPNLGTWIDAFVKFAKDSGDQWAISFPNMRTEFTNLRTTIETEAPLIADAMGRLWKAMFGEPEGGAGGGVVRFLEGTFEAIGRTLGTIITQVRIMMDILATAIEATKAFASGDFTKFMELSQRSADLWREFGDVTGGQYDWFRNFMQNGPGTSGRATGGRSTFGGMTWVGERGPELVNLPGGSHVYTNAQSMAMAGGSQHLSITLDVRGESALPADRNKIRELAAALQRELQLTGARVVTA